MSAWCSLDLCNTSNENPPNFVCIAPAFTGCFEDTQRSQGLETNGRHVTYLSTYCTYNTDACAVILPGCRLPEQIGLRIEHMKTRKASYNGLGLRLFWRCPAQPQTARPCTRLRLSTSTPGPCHIPEAVRLQPCHEDWARGVTSHAYDATCHVTRLQKRSYAST